MIFALGCDGEVDDFVLVFGDRVEVEGAYGDGGVEVEGAYGDGVEIEGTYSFGGGAVEVEGTYSFGGGACSFGRA